MKILIVNSVCGVGSTGRICLEQAEEFRREGHSVMLAYGRKNIPNGRPEYAVKIESALGCVLSALHTRLTDSHGFANKSATKKFIRLAQEFDPDILYIHNLHGYYVNIELLLEWAAKRRSMKTVLILHDCWLFTGHCAFFSSQGCEKWKSGCGSCPISSSYPRALVDNSRKNYERKRRLFERIEEIGAGESFSIQCPSNWLADLVKSSFLSNLRLSVLPNRVDTEVFKPTQSQFRSEYMLEDKKIVLGVANVWSKRKGLDDFLALSKILGEDYKIVLVGLSGRQKRTMPKSILAIGHIESKKRLAELYSAADVFANLTHDDNYPSVNLEAAACGCVCVGYTAGGNAESLTEGCTAQVGEVNKIAEIIKEACADKKRR